MACGFDPVEFDAIERQMWAGIWTAAERVVAAERGIELRRFGPVQTTTIADLPDAASINLVLGATAPGAVEEGHLEAALDWVDSQGVGHYVPVTPDLPDSGVAAEWLEQRGYSRGYGWTKFVRDTAPPQLPETQDLEVVELGAGQGRDFGMIVAEGFGLPSWAASLFLELPDRGDWRCYSALIDGNPAASAAMVINGRLAEFGLAATLPPARGRGCQQALLRRRIVDAAGSGCNTLLVETGERQAGRPSASYRNILRAGFSEAYARPNWVRSAA
jgi:GNAT superfamily N-acetyltransferase